MRVLKSILDGIAVEEPDGPSVLASAGGSSFFSTRAFRAERFVVPADFSDLSDVPAQKARLRREARARILSVPATMRALDDACLRQRVTDLPGFADARVVLLYCKAFPEEIETRPLIDQVLASGRTLILPRVRGRDELLALARVTDPESQLVPGALAIPEPARDCPEVAPAQVEWVLVPGLAFDESCYRIGRGAGHYDRLLACLDRAVPRWAIAYDEQLFDHLPTQSHDQVLSGIATPKRLVFQPLS